MTDDRSFTEQHVRLPGLDPEATPLVGLGLSLTGLVLGLRPRLAAWPLALTAAAALFYRDPERATPAAEGMLFAPADGTVRAIEETYEHRFLHTDAVRLAIAVSPLDVPVQRSPLAGRIAYLEEVASEHRLGWSQRDTADESERGACLLIGIDAGWTLALLAITAGALVRRPQCRVALNESVEAGARLATARLGARVELLLPCDVFGDLPGVGERVQAGLTRVGVGVAR
jgi:phosphatidylserine decarboxylase